MSENTIHHIPTVKTGVERRNLPLLSALMHIFLVVVSAQVAYLFLSLSRNKIIRILLKVIYFAVILSVEFLHTIIRLNKMCLVFGRRDKTPHSVTVRDSHLCHLSSFLCY